MSWNARDNDTDQSSVDDSDEEDYDASQYLDELAALDSYYDIEEHRTPSYIARRVSVSTEDSSVLSSLSRITSGPINLKAPSTVP